MKSLLKYFEIAVLTALLVFSLAACGNRINGDPTGPSDPDNPPDVPPIEKTLDRIEISEQPGKTSYTVGEILNTSGLEVTAYYTDNTSEKITGYTIGNFDSSEAGSKTITVMYENKTAQFTVMVNSTAKTLQSITVSGPAKTSYYLGDTLDLNGLVVTAIYSDSSSVTVNAGDYVTSGFNSNSAGEHTITVSYGGKTATFTVTVSVPPLESIAVTKQPVKTIYEIDEQMDITGIEVTATYSNGYTAPITITIANITGFSSAADGTITITVDYNGKTTTFTVTVNPAEPGDISVTGVTLDHDTLSMTTGETATLTATVNPANAANRAVTWSSDNPEVAAVDNGVITANDAGTATITVTTVDGNKTAACLVTVQTLPTPAIPVILDSIIPDGSTTATTTKLTLTFRQDISGLNASDITFSPGSIGKGTLIELESGVFELPVNNITASGQVTVTVSKSGYFISPDSMTINVFYSSNIDIGIGDPTIKLYLNGGVNSLQEGGSTTISQGTGTFTISIASGTYTEIIWYVNGNVAAQGPTRTTYALPKRTSGTYLVTVEATPSGGVKNSGSHSFVVQ